MQNHIAIFCYWRTGSNALSDYFIDQGFSNYNEYYSEIVASLVEDPNMHPELAQLHIEKANDYFRGTLLQHQGRLNTVVKFMYPHIQYVSNEVLDTITTKILLYRENFLNLILSKFVAHSRNEWERTIWNPHQETIELTYSYHEFMADADKILNDFERFISDRNFKYDYVVSYEKDLVPYIAINGSNYLVSNNYYVSNIDQLAQLYRDRFEHKFEKVLCHFQSVRDGAKSINDLSESFKFKYYN